MLIVHARKISDNLSEVVRFIAIDDHLRKYNCFRILGCAVVVIRFLTIHLLLCIVI